MRPCGQRPSLRAGAWLRERFLVLLTAGVLAFGCLTSALDAQERDLGPTFLLQPGMLTTDFISADDATASGTGFNFRFATLLPTRHNWLRPVFGVNIVPYGTTGFTSTNTNSPSVFIGNVFPLVAKRRLGGWLQVDVPILWYYTHDGGGSSNQRLFGKDLYIELAISLPLGEKLFKDLGPGWNRLETYLLFDQNLTPNENTVSGHTDRFNPVALYGVSIRFGKGT